MLSPALAQLQAAIADTGRRRGNFDVSLPLSAADMLQSDIKSDILHTFADRSSTRAAQFSVTSVWAMHFHALRELYLDSQRDFVQSLAWAASWEATGGKSGARFERSADHRFVLKAVSKTEFDMFNEHIAAAYFQHMYMSLVEGVPTLLVKILGAYKVSIPSKKSSYVIVMDDLFHQHVIPPGLKFDLKGKLRAQKRHVPLPGADAAAGGGPAAVPPGAAGGGGAAAGGGGGAITYVSAADLLPPPEATAYDPFNVAGVLPSAAGRSTSGGGASAPPPPPPSPVPPAVPPAPLDAASQLVLLDGEFVTFTRGYPLPLQDDAKRLLDAMVEHDTSFLCGIKVVDYSVLLGIEASTGRLVVGIIDYIRCYDLAKQIENRMKQVTALATNEEPTVVKPQRYKERLQRALDRYFATAPTKWTALSSWEEGGGGGGGGRGGGSGAGGGGGVSALASPS